MVVPSGLRYTHNLQTVHGWNQKGVFSVPIAASPQQNPISTHKYSGVLCMDKLNYRGSKGWGKEDDPLRRAESCSLSHK